MNTVDTLLTLAEIAIAVIGFAGIVFALRSRISDRAEAMHRLRMRIMIEASGYVMLFSMLPALLLPEEISDESVWQAGTALLAVTSPVLVASIYVRQRRRFGSTLLRETLLFDSFTILVAVVVEALLLLASTGQLPGRAASVYVLGLLFPQGAAVAMFVRALFSSSQSSDSPPTP